ncbi:MAG TPA: FAD-binding and (Fe-S)-binding domain-containing protein [Rhodocyclaceae bacterium]
MSELIAALHQRLAPSQVITDELRRLAWGTDASFYRLVPEVVVVVENEDEVRDVLALAQRFERHLTFRAAGTSLSGQAVSDGILVLIGEGFATCEIAADGGSVRLGPGIIGGEVNRRLAPLGRKIGPDPASINTCKIGGIAANNASGMCCGTAQNSYQTLLGMRVLLADGSVLDSEDPASVAAFRQQQAALLAELAAIGRSARHNPELAALIRRKYKIKNTTGYSLNALVDFEDPIDILAHLMIGSEGTLGFISRISYRTVVEHAHKASALVFFADIASACEAVIELKKLPVAAVEILDRASLHSVENKPGLPAVIKTLGEGAAALLIEVREQNAALLQSLSNAVLAALAAFATVEPARFSTDPAECEVFWNVRKGTFPSVGAMRETGTTVIIEDVAFPIESLAAATLDLQALLHKHGYREAIIFGHALEGNLHFVFTQDFGNAAEVARYAKFMDEVCELVAVKYQGSLKAEHGTGRNMAPFVELEWGREAADLMRRIKALFDPAGLLNPGVILNDNPHAHLENLKPLPAAAAVVDKCIECGFCEPQCPSHQLTLSPRQRITSWRELSRRQRENPAGEAAGSMADDYVYMGMDTCAGCGLCSTACPVGIDTGALIRELRGQRQSETAKAVGGYAAKHFGTVAALARRAVAIGQGAAYIFGDKLVGRVSGGAWRKNMPGAAKLPSNIDPVRPEPVEGRVNQPTSQLSGFDRLSPNGVERSDAADPVVYFPTCANRIFGAAEGDPPLPDTIVTLLARAGYAPRLPAGYDNLCCGQSFASKGLEDAAEAAAAKLESALFEASDNGRLPVVMDASPCAARMKARLAGRIRVLDFPEFADAALLPRLRLQKQQAPIALHLNCSARRQGEEGVMRRLAAACASEVVVPSDVKCCGFGGDRGFAVPELNVHALRHIHAALPDACACGVSSNRTCELGLTAETGRPYRSIAYLLEECSREEDAMHC